MHRDAAKNPKPVHCVLGSLPIAVREGAGVLGGTCASVGGFVAEREAAAVRVATDGAAGEDEGDVDVDVDVDVDLGPATFLAIG